MSANSSNPIFEPCGNSCGKMICRPCGKVCKMGPLLRGNEKRFKGGLVFKAHRFMFHSTLGSRVTKKKKKKQKIGFSGRRPRPCRAGGSRECLQTRPVRSSSPGLPVAPPSEREVIGFMTCMTTYCTSITTYYDQHDHGLGKLDQPDLRAQVSQSPPHLRESLWFREREREFGSETVESSTGTPPQNAASHKNVCKLVQADLRAQVSQSPPHLKRVY